MKLLIQCVVLSHNRNLGVVGLSWYHGKVTPKRPVLAICYENGKLQIMRNENDEGPVILNTGIQAVDSLWNHDGTILAVCGVKVDINAKDSNQIMFYTPHGVLLRTLKIPGKEITALSWEGQSLRIALAVDSFIYFANIRPDYMWCYFEKTVVYLNRNPETESQTITFWNTLSNQVHLKEVEQPLGMASSSEHCVVAIEVFNINLKDTNVAIERNLKDRTFQLLICNSLGTTVDSKYLDIRPEIVAMNSTHVVAASKDHFLLWYYHTPKITSNLHNTKGRKDKKYHIDDTPSGVIEVLNDLDKGGFDLPVNNNPTQDPICSLAISEKLLLVARESGVINEYSVPNVALRTRHTLNNRAFKMAINCNSTRAAIIDFAGTLSTVDLDDTESKININRMERKDVWAICWAQDNPQLLALMEKTRMYVLRGNDPEEPISSAGYICNFEDLEITSVLLDDIINGGQTQNNTDHIIKLRVKSLRDTEDLLAHVGIAEAKQFIEDNPHPRLWRLLAESSLKKLDLDTAENAFVRCTNYPGLQLIKRLKTIPNENLQRAEIYAFYCEFDEAEKLYMDADRRDLAISLRITLSDWFRTVQLYRMGPGISDQQMETAYKEIGNHFANMRSWESAKEYYDKAHCIEGLMGALYHLEQYEELESCINKLSEKSPLLSKLAEMLTSVGMCDSAVAAFIKLGDIKSAVNTCVNLRNWGQAVELAQRYKMPQIGALLSKHAAHLLQEGRLPEAVELQRKAGRFLDAAHLLTKLAEREMNKKSNYLRSKKLFVLAGILAEDHIKVQISLTGLNRTTIISEMSAEESNLVEQIWHKAEAFHFMLLAQKQLRFGIVHSAVITALRLREYEDVLAAEEIYSLLALASCADRSFGTCSKAFIKLESLESINERSRQDYEELAVSIFSKNEPYDNKVDRVTCFTCESLVPDCLSSCTSCGVHFPPCVASGKPLVQPLQAWLCSTCHHCASPMEIAGRKSCPLCHSAISKRKDDLENM